jgi:hypothetical protein
MTYIKFNKEAARRGEPVITRCGEKVRILCFDLKNKDFPIAFAFENMGRELVQTATDEGYHFLSGEESVLDLFMAPKVKTFWLNIYSTMKTGHCSITPIAGVSLYSSAKEAMSKRNTGFELIKTIPVEIEV